MSKYREELSRRLKDHDKHAETKTWFLKSLASEPNLEGFELSFLEWQFLDGIAKGFFRLQGRK